MSKIDTIGIIGAGTMGSGIAQMAGMAGYKVVLFDSFEKALVKAEKTINKNLNGALDRGKITKSQKSDCLDTITFTGSFDKVVADVIIEAVIEDAALKKEIFNNAALQNTDQTILASNTSSIPITQIAAGISHPERVVGMHFFNPVHIMKLVEVVSSPFTDPNVAETIKTLAESMGKKAVMAKDAPGFIVNRVARPFYVESLKILEENIAPVNEIDRLMEASGFRMGPFRLMDLIGVDSNFYTTRSMYNSFHQAPRFRPSRIQEMMVLAGKHGRKTGKGFYDYD
jgi:3-hydroxybutyryl-CoA dehydrogenase